MAAFLAALPILVLLVLMVGLRWSAARAGVVACGVALAVGVLAFAFPHPVDPALGLMAGLGGVGAEAGFTALTILWIIGPALGIHHLQLRTGAAEVLRAWLGQFASDPRILALLIAWFFVLFMEGAAGFGASVALAAPFLVGAGFTPVAAVTITLIGHVVGVSFGAVGTPIVPQMASTGLSGLELARATGPYHTLLGWVPLMVMVVLTHRAMPEVVGGEAAGHQGARRRSTPAIAGWTLLAFVAFTLPYTLIWSGVGPELPTLGGALFGGGVFVLLLALTSRHAPPSPDPMPSGRKAIRAAAPYLVLVVLVLVTRLVPPLQEVLRGVSLEWSLHGGAFGGSIELLYHPGSMLLAGFLVGALLQKASMGTTGLVVRDATLQLVPVAVALVAMLGLARVTVHAGMTEVLALAAAGAVGGAWPFFAPLVGVLGTFVSGSATASNILFTDLQQETARTLDLPVDRVVGAQTFGAAVGNMVCPHNVIAAGATVGLAGREGEILRRTLGVTVLYAVLGGILALVLIR
ncbi:MAG: L-lactate permease [Gemmatimonadales bacterium]|nr:MAG: L-lactate permease [Gemmatimonadales bacterium]